MYVNNIRIERISSCCEYKYNKGAKLGTGTIQFLSVEGAAPCFKCNVRRGYLKVKNYKKWIFDEKTKNLGKTRSRAAASLARLIDQESLE